MYKSLFFACLFISLTSFGQKGNKYDSTVKMGKAGYRVTCMNRSIDRNTLNIRPIGFKSETREASLELRGRVVSTEIDDLNNDGFPEIVSMDMLPKDPYILKRSLGEDDYDIYQYKISVGYDYQFTRNNLQWNRRNGKFSEVGMYAGMFATDWSWATLLMDFDNDGYKDIFVANGIPKRMNDMDYVNYVSNQEIQEKIRLMLFFLYVRQEKIHILICLN